MSWDKMNLNFLKISITPKEIRKSIRIKQQIKEKEKLRRDLFNKNFIVKWQYFRQQSIDLI